MSAMNNNGYIPCVNPATGEQFLQVPASTPEEVRQARRQMAQHLPLWKGKSVQERARILKKFQEVLLNHADEITEVVNLDTGKSRQDALSELFLVVDKLNTYRQKAPKWLKRERISPGIYVFKRYFTEPVPYGVVAVIGPWNMPLDLTLPPAYAALLAGNTVILKPSEVTPAVGKRIEELFQSVPELSPFVRVLHGGPEVGAALVDTQPDLVFLTGSTGTGRKVAQAAAETLTPFICELGGNDPMIVLEDANIEEAARWGAWGAFFHSGQTCVSVERVYVVEEVYERFIEAVLAESQKWRQGYSVAKENPNGMGPLTFDRQLETIEDHLQDALDKGARVLAGGRCDGLFMEPTVLVDVDHSMKLMKEETFGPIMPIMRVADATEAVQLANSSEYGLSACVWSEDLEEAERIARLLEAGSVVVNDTLAHYAVSELPFGGVKKSGTARTHGKQDLLQFTQLKAYGVGPTPVFLDIAAQLREPNRYHLLNAIMHALFGVTLRQRLKAIPALAAHFRRRAGADAAPAAVPGKQRRSMQLPLAAVGALGGLIALALSVLRGRR